MSLDDDRFLMREHARLRQSYQQADHDPDAGSPEAIEVMQAEFMAHCRTEMPWKFQEAPGLAQDDAAADREAAREDDLRPRVPQGDAT